MEIRYLYGVKISDKEREYLESKINKVKKLIGNAEGEVKAEVEVEQDKKGFWRVEVMVKTPKEFFRADKITDNLNGSIDQVEEILMKTIRRRKEKKIDMSRKRVKAERLESF